MNEEFCPVCGENDVTEKSIICSVCKYKCCISCLRERDLCQICFDELCPICNKTKINGDCNNQKYCEKCCRICCIKCISLTGCQTTFGICIECFDYLCVVCHEKRLLTTTLYLEDHNEHYRICDRCKKDNIKH
jgi:hypothetical protein